MAIQLSDNISINAAKPDGARYFNRANRPYESVQQVLSELAQSVLHEGLTVNVMGIEYWFPDGINIEVKSSGTGSVGVTDVTYNELITMIDDGGLVTGAQYRITDYKTIHNMLDYADLSVLLDYDNSVPAPTNIVVTPNAVGANPVTYYCVAFGLFDVRYKLNDTYVSLFSEEFTYTEGDDTTSTMISYDFGYIDNVDLINIVILRGIESGVYTSYLDGISKYEPLPYDMYSQFSIGNTSDYYNYSGYPINVVNTGDPEALIVTANDSNSIDKLARSETYPQDIIYYDWNPDKWKLDSAFSNYSDFNNSNADSLTIVDGFKGVIYFRHDTYNDNYMGYDFRNVKYRRWEIMEMPWEATNVYNKGVYVTYNNILYISISESNLGFTPQFNNLKWGGVLTLTDKFFVAEMNYSNGKFQAGSAYVDVKTFDLDPTLGNTATYEKSCLSNHFSSYRDDTDKWNSVGSILTNNVFFLNTEPQIYMNAYGYSFANNTCFGAFNDSNVGDNCQFNLFIGGFSFNNALTKFYNNVVKNMDSCDIATNFNYNFIDNNVSSNTFKNNVQNSIFNNGFYGNTVNNSVNGVVVSSYASKCVFDDGVSNINLNSNTEVSDMIRYSNYNHRIFIGNGNSVFIEWFDEFYDKNILQIQKNN